MKKNDVFVTAVLCFEGAATWWVHVMTVLHAKHYIYMRIIYSVLPEPKNTELTKTGVYQDNYHFYRRHLDHEL